MVRWLKIDTRGAVRWFDSSLGQWYTQRFDPRTLRYLLLRCDLWSLGGMGGSLWPHLVSPGLRAFMDVEWWLSTRTQNKSLKWWPKNPNVWWFVSSPLLVDLLIDPLRTGDVWHEHDSCTSSWSSVRINMWNIVSMSLWGPSPGDQTTRLGSLRPPNHAEEKMQQPSSPAFRELELLGSRSDFVRVAMTVSCVLVQVQLCPVQVV